MNQKSILNVLLCVACIACAGMLAGRLYLVGRMGGCNLWNLPDLLLLLLPWILGPLCIVILFRLYVHDHTTSIVWLLIAVAAFALSIPASGMFGEDLFLRGFHARVSAVASPDELRQLAQVARTVLPDGHYVCDMYPQDERWKKLSSTTIINRLGHRLEVSAHRSCVTIGWRALFWGSWGIQIYNGKPPPSQNTQEVIRTMAVTDDIEVSFYAH